MSNYQRNFNYKMAYEREWPTEQEFTSLYEIEGNPLSEIADLYECPYSTFNNFVKKQGWKVRSVGDYACKRKTREMDQVLTKENLTLWYETEKKGTLEIADMTGFTRDSVLRRLKRFGFHIRRSAYITWSHALLVKKLRNDGIDIQDWQLNYRVMPTRYMVDIGFPEIRLAIEIDGRSHFEENDGFYGPRIDYDRRRDQKLEDLGWKVVRFTDHDIRFRLEATIVKTKIELGLNSHERRASLDKRDDDIVRHSIER